jgi:hypothetical protein
MPHLPGNASVTGRLISCFISPRLPSDQLLIVKNENLSYIRKTSGSDFV